MNENKRLGFTHLNVKMMYDVCMKIHDYDTALLHYIVMHSDNMVFSEKQKTIAENMQISQRTVSRHLRSAEEGGLIKRIGFNKWECQFYFEPDEEFERITDAPKGTCFKFLDEFDESEELDDITFEESYKLAMEEWNKLPKNQK